MKKKICILLIIILCIIIITGISSANNNRYIATDEEIFGENALVSNSEEDQSNKLEKCVIKAANDKKQLYIPAGKYYINKSVLLEIIDISISGDKDDATILINKDKTKNVVLDADHESKNVKNLTIENLFLDGIGLRVRDKPNLKVENNIFYNFNGDYMVHVFCGKNTNINHNIFLRDKERAEARADRNARTISVTGYNWGGKYKWAEDVYIRDNIVGAKIDELDAIKSLQKENNQNIVRLQKAIKEKKISLKNEQNYITTGVNSYCNLKNAYIEDNFFYSNYDDQEKEQNPIEHDHATYLRGSQNVHISGNHMRGFQNGPYGGFKFKSGRDLVVMNNYIRNSSIILSNRPEYGLTETFEEGRTSQFTRVLLANNIFDFKKWQRTYAVAIHSHTDNPDKMPTKIDGIVVIDNKYINYMNIAPKPREGIQLADKFEPNLYNYNNTYIKGNTRDDTKDKKLTSWRWKNNEEALLPDDWRPMLSKEPSLEKYYNKKKEIRIPFLNMLATAVPTTINIGEELEAEKLVKNAYDKDNKKPIYIITNKEELKTPGEKEIVVKIIYEDQIPEVNITVPVTVVGKKEEETKKEEKQEDKVEKEENKNEEKETDNIGDIEIKKTNFEREEKVNISDIIAIDTDSKKIDIKVEPEIDELKIGKQAIKIIVTDKQGKKKEKEVEIEIVKSKLQKDIEELFKEDGIIKKELKQEKITELESKIEEINNAVVKAEFKELVQKAKKQLEDKKKEQKNEENIITKDEKVETSKEVPKTTEKEIKSFDNDKKQEAIVTENTKKIEEEKEKIIDKNVEKNKTELEKKKVNNNENNTKVGILPKAGRGYNVMIIFGIIILGIIAIIGIIGRKKEKK